MLIKFKRVLVIGIGGGGDIVSTLPVKAFLESLGVEVLTGSVIWERFHRDPFPGPRNLNSLENVKKVGGCLGLTSGGTVIKDTGVELIPSRVAEITGNDVLLIDINHPSRLMKDLENYVMENGFEFVIGVDAGGDALTTGREKGLRSPLADALMISILKNIPSNVCVTGMGSDGELKREELERNMTLLAKWGEFAGCHEMPPEVLDLMERVIENVDTEASKIPFMGARGYYGKVSIRNGIQVDVSLISSLCFYFTASGVYRLNALARAVDGSETIQEASSRLNSIGIKTELDLERELYERKGGKK